jgi:hypothetical protein
MVAISETLCSVIRRLTKSREPVILSAVYCRQIVVQLTLNKSQSELCAFVGEKRC